MDTIYKVCIPHTHYDFFDYRSPTLHPCIGARVWVPFRKQTRLGIVIGKGASNQTAPDTLKLIHEVIDEQPLLSDSLLELCQWVSHYYQSPLSEVIPLALPKTYRLGKKSQLPVTDYYQLALPADKAHALITTRAHRQHALIDFLARQEAGVSKKTLLDKDFKQPQFKPLVELGILQVHQRIALPVQVNQTINQPLILNPEQGAAVHTISHHLNKYHCFLLYGVTGSGKTEVYFQVISQVLAQGRQVLILVPEIGLTPQLLTRFKARFNEPMVVIHSNLNETERQYAWQLASNNLVKLVIGTRTAIFTPMPTLGLIVIDEEHDLSLKQMEGVRYSARDTALLRAYKADIPVILGSATPSLESLYNCLQGKYSLLRLNQKALNSNPLHYQILDIRHTPLQHGLATNSLNIINEHLKQNNQVLIFINRRGFAPVLLCSCGWIADCPACDSHFTLHRKSARLICHHCGLANPIPSQCKKCHSKELMPIGAGTQRIYEYLAEQFPDASLLRIDRDVVQRKNALNNHLERIAKGEATLIVGTQMLAKGHHFPRLTLVVILDADAGFFNQDFRALERLGQLLTQVAGRAGRAHFPGQVVIQTHLPHHPLLNLLIQEGYEAFAEALLASRQEAQFPPYHFLAMIRAQDKSAEKVLGFLQRIKKQLVSQEINVLGPAPAPLARKANQHRMQLLVKSPSRKKLQTTLTQLREWLTINKLTHLVRWNVDMDPMDLS
ncbi:MULTISPECIES: primosomal protein N' [unclassified Legionella]|uniref:primosomal protein N' n=1 Tax=unclassified Legionella TaxID=2622702 RepID=UPI001054EDD9|nr:MULTISPECIES: primosomal protein N' [unclassified Legionella]MDI9819638.1 primosomal protein N' [Legionella sp. PL877]